MYDVPVFVATAEMLISFIHNYERTWMSPRIALDDPYRLLIGRNLTDLTAVGFRNQRVAVGLPHEAGRKRHEMRPVLDSRLPSRQWITEESEKSVKPALRGCGTKNQPRRRWPR
ncbi:MAG TPA: hypothetical protein DDY78_07640 [Planctomycetales bacterium]|nr:hypothetical protein [Planctomycetales bacterium]